MPSAFTQRRHLGPIRRHDLACGARGERAIVRERGPALVSAGRMSQADLDRLAAAWTTLACLFDDGAADPGTFDWDELERIVSDNLARREADVATMRANPNAAHPELVEGRRDDVRAVHAFLTDQRTRRAAMPQQAVAA